MRKVEKMGTLIVIDGLDGSGKNTQSKLLYDRLQKEGKQVCLVSFPDYESPACAPVKMYLGGEFGSDPEAVGSYAASTFFAVDRFASFRLNWKEAYDNGAIIIANRYTTANAIHQLTKPGYQVRVAGSIRTEFFCNLFSNHPGMMICLILFQHTLNAVFGQAHINSKVRSDVPGAVLLMYIFRTNFRF